MNIEQNALVIVAEEIGELALELLLLQKHLHKAIRFGLNEQRDLPTSNKERIEAEWNDLLGSIEKLKDIGFVLIPDMQAIAKKMEKIEKYNQYSEDLGQLRHD
jgi:hypothetical protein